MYTFAPNSRASYLFHAGPAVAADPVSQAFGLFMHRATGWRRALLSADFAIDRETLALRPGAAKFAALLRAEGIELGLHVLPTYALASCVPLQPYWRLDGEGEPIPAMSEPDAYQLSDEGVEVYCGLLAQHARALKCTHAYSDAAEDAFSAAEWAADPVAGHQREAWISQTYLAACEAIGARVDYLEGSSPRKPEGVETPVDGGATDYDLDGATFLQELERNLARWSAPDGDHHTVPGTIGWISPWKDPPPANPVTLADFQLALDACAQYGLPMGLHCWPQGAPADIDAWMARMREMEAARRIALGGLREPYSDWFDALRTALGAADGPFAAPAGEGDPPNLARVQYWLDDGLDELLPDERLVEALTRDGRPQALISWPGSTADSRAGGGNVRVENVLATVRFACGSPRRGGFISAEDAYKADGAAGYWGAMRVHNFVLDRVFGLDVAGFDGPALLLGTQQLRLRDQPHGVLAYVMRFQVPRLREY